MARYIGPVCKICRREGMKLYMKGDRCYSEKCAITRRPKPPGQHGDKRIKLSEYGIRLREKNKVRKIYGVLEKQYRKYFSIADRQKGRTGENLLGLLERRLDNIVYRLGFAASRNEGRQVVLHNHVLVNGKRVNVPSFQVKVGDQVVIREQARAQKRIESAIAASDARPQLSWLEVDKKNFAGTIKGLPVREELNEPAIREQYVVEYYSR
ncbi:MAG: 30S ribosomal protein S4 [Myxococcales bacterium]|nr:30S ribosomal protein S4 [Myxococcales bacterium]MBL8721413.1 30S ribosomal protein S4 [Myxococcales bacterium]